MDQTNHTITLTHLGSETQRFVCSCGEGHIGLSGVVRALILGHRMAVFPLLRARL